MLDAVTQAQIWHAVLQQVKERKIGVLAISHDHHLLERVSDRIVHFRHLVTTHKIIASIKRIRRVKTIKSGKRLDDIGGVGDGK
ncbi:hypothetical protein [Paracerasibacillus soli]|uniref:Uncharacterized protein n=1 Tax=Paracerasibacillus soli TaxID=480284 RepID=A0ABU5CU24_9BACI|nr:hypothetical protein [Virgibacillus soli]MDY0409858.1 hypothetical protein [Virgibacillus soli]